MPEVVRLNMLDRSYLGQFLPFLFLLKYYGLHRNCHKIFSDTISIGGVPEILRVSYRNFKAFVGGRGRN